jgi:hypothetical protein
MASVAPWVEITSVQSARDRQKVKAKVGGKFAYPAGILVLLLTMELFATLHPDFVEKPLYRPSP